LIPDADILFSQQGTLLDKLKFFNTMKKICLLFIIFSLGIISFGQTSKGRVYLKNGSIVKGKISRSENSEILRIYSAGNLWVFPLTEVEKVEYSLTTPEKELHESNSKVTNHTQIGVLAGNNDNTKAAPFMLHSMLNFKVDKKIQAGFGTGVEFLNETHLPVFANIEYRFREAGISPYLFVKAGYCFPLEDTRMTYYQVVPYYYSTVSSYIWPGPWYYGNEELKAKGGLLLNPGFGMSVLFSNNFGMSFSVGYRYSRLHYKGENNYGLDVDYNRLSISLGIIFN
jgi:hypothetical protein